MVIDSDDQHLFRTTSGAPKAKFNTNGSVELYNAGAKKFETTSSGVSVTGTISAGNFVGTGNTGNSGFLFGTGAWYHSNEGKERFYFYNNGSSLWNTADAHLFQHNGSTKFTVDSGGNCHCCR